MAQQWAIPIDPMHAVLQITTKPGEPLGWGHPIDDDAYYCEWCGWIPELGLGGRKVRLQFISAFS